MLTAVNSEMDTVIAEASLARNIPYACPECSSPVIFKAGRHKIPHFAHAPRAESCAYGSNESHLHLALKMELFNRLKGGWRVSLEQKIGAHRTDVYALSPSGQRFCFEVQHSPISEDEIFSRMTEYSRIGAITVWILAGGPLSETNHRKVIPIKQWWMFLQKMQMGVLCLGGPKQFRGQSVRYDFRFFRLEPAYSWVEATDFGGGYWRRLKRSKELSLSPSGIWFDALTPRRCQDTGVLTFKIPFGAVWWEREEYKKSPWNIGNDFILGASRD